MPPWGVKTKGPQIIRAVGQGRKPKRTDHPKIEEYECADALWELFQACWEVDPQDRPRAGEVIALLKPMLHQLGKKGGGAVQQPPPPRHPRVATQSEARRRDLALQPGGADSRLGQGQQVFGRATQPIVLGYVPPPPPPSSKYTAQPENEVTTQAAAQSSLTLPSQHHVKLFDKPSLADTLYAVGASLDSFEPSN